MIYGDIRVNGDVVGRWDAQRVETRALASERAS